MQRSRPGRVECFAFDVAANAPKTGDSANITGYVSIDGATPVQLADTNPDELSAANASGVYSFVVTAAETNGVRLAFTFKSSTANVQLEPVGVSTVMRDGIELAAA